MRLQRKNVREPDEVRRFTNGRVDIHIGEVELLSRDVRRIAVHPAARIMALARPREVLMSGVTADLLDGSGLTFEECGSHELKGLIGARRIVALTG